MDYLLTFLEGIITFISPCLLPMLPIYISYFAGQEPQGKRKRAIVNALGFVLGFTAVFVAMGAFAGVAGFFLRQHQTALNIISGAVVIVFGLGFLGVVRIPFIGGGIRVRTTNLGFFSSVLFGVVFAIGWTPCVGAFLGSALMLAARSGESARGVLLLLCFSLGLGIPFVVSAALIERLRSAFDVIKRHYRVINIVSGGLLIAVGILMATGAMGYLLSLLTF